MSASEAVKVVVNPTGSAKVLQSSLTNTDSAQCPGQASKSIQRTNGQTIYIAGCAVGTATIRLVRASDTSQTITSYSFQVTAKPAPPVTTACPAAGLRFVSGEAAHSNSWGLTCYGKSTNVPSSYRRTSYSRFYTFTLSRTTVVEINLGSSTRTYPYLYLIDSRKTKPDITTGSAIGSDKSRIVKELPAGTYAVEASALTRKNFTLRVIASNCSVGGLGQVLSSSKVSQDISHRGRWTGKCLSPSSKRLGKRAAFRSFTLNRAAAVRIDLTASGRNPKLFLLSGNGTSGSAVNHSSAKDGSGASWKVFDNLPKGDYTIEAVSTSGDTAANFTLEMEAYALNTLRSSGLYGTLRATYAVAEGEKYELQSYQSYIKYSPTGVTLRTTYMHATTLEGCLALRDSNVLSGNPRFRPAPANAARRAMIQCAPKTGEPPTLLYHWSNFYGTRFSHGPDQPASATVVKTTAFPRGPASPYTLGWDIFFARDPAYGIYSVCNNCTE